LHAENVQQETKDCLAKKQPVGRDFLEAPGPPSLLSQIRATSHHFLETWESLWVSSTTPNQPTGELGDGHLFALMQLQNKKPGGGNFLETPGPPPPPLPCQICPTSHRLLEAWERVWLSSTMHDKQTGEQGEGHLSILRQFQNEQPVGLNFLDARGPPPPPLPCQIRPTSHHLLEAWERVWVSSTTPNEQTGEQGEGHLSILRQFQNEQPVGLNFLDARGPPPPPLPCQIRPTSHHLLEA
jgi:hypothetical protein